MDELRIGKYAVTGQLGRGGMGIVYRGYDPAIRRHVALKVIRKAELDPYELPTILERFKREAQAAGSLHHPNIVAIYDYGEDDRHAFIAMECVTGRSLRDHIVAGYRPEFRDFPEVIEQLLEGLDYSHSRGVVHRDLKPANLLVSESGVVKISDFGIARLETSHLTSVGEVMGTPFYMAPEQFRGEHTDERTDIYAAAVITYEVLCGRRPFQGLASALMKQVLEDEPEPPSRHEPRIGPELDEVILKGLAKRPADRWSSVRAFSSALHQAFSMGVQAAPSTPTRAPGDTTVPQAPSPGRVAGNAAALRRTIAPAATGRGEAAAATDGAGRPAPVRAAASPQAIRRPCVLFVDDEERVLNALRALFKTSFDIVTAAGGEQALEIVRARHVHLVVCDQRMPGMAGVEVLRRVRELSPATVRILLTGYSDLAAIVGSVNEGEVYRFINKPWNQTDLQTTLAEAVTIGLALQASPPREVEAIEPGLTALVLDDDAMFRAVRELSGGRANVVHATTLEQALQTLGTAEVAVLVADLELGNVDNTVLFRVLKEEHPETLVIVTTGASDSELVIDLINEARIFRFLNKPLNLTLLQQHVTAALERYQQFRQSPQYVQTQKARSSARARESSLGQAIIASLKRFSSRLSAAFRQ
jgi:serine/threonine-protein kinase